MPNPALPVLILAVLALSACGGGADPPAGPPAGLPADATVSYTFRDSSVPPPYHRSFVLTFDRAQARIVVDSYGDVLADRSAPMTAQAWTQVSETFAGLRDIVIVEPEQGCVGGTSFVLAVSGSATFDLSGTQCGGANSNAAERLTQWIRPVRSLFPPMAQLAPEG
ncbi:MAG: hypothetical protein ACKOB8_06150 [Mycobacterium sp.]